MTETKTVTKKTVSAEAPVKKAPAKPRVKKAETAISSQQRYEMIQHAAYFIAECNSFEGDPHTYWTEAEAQINNAYPQ